MSDTFYMLNGQTPLFKIHMQPSFKFLEDFGIYKEKIMPWKSLCKIDTLETIVSTSKYMAENYYASEEVKPHVLKHLTNLERNFLNCLLNFSNMNGSEIQYQLQSVRK